jgi:predicted HicB family RNase H-like nuclease
MAKCDTSNIEKANGIMAKPEGKTATLSLRIRPSLKRAAVQRAKASDRSLANYLEQLIVADAKKAGGKRR